MLSEEFYFRLYFWKVSFVGLCGQIGSVFNCWIMRRLPMIPHVEQLPADGFDFGYEVHPKI